jgi:guanine nucleotide exchange factor synembryn
MKLPIQVSKDRFDLADGLARIPGLSCKHYSLTCHKGCDDLLTALHLHTRTIRNSTTDPLTTKRGMSVVAGYAFNKDQVPVETRRKGLRCLNNILVLTEPLRQVFVDEKYPEKVIELLRVRFKIQPVSGLAMDLIRITLGRRCRRRTGSLQFASVSISQDKSRSDALFRSA